MKKFKPTVIEQNVFKQTVLDDIVQHVRKIGKKMDYVHDWKGLAKGKLLAERYFWSWKDHSDISDRLTQSLNTDIMKPAIVEHSFVLDSYYPYEIHCDSGWLDLKAGGTFEPWYLVIIPITPNASKTINFEQCEENAKHFMHYKENNEPLKEYIDDEYFKQNLSHCWDHDQPYLTLEKEFAWNQGSVMYCDMRRYHASNDYRSNGIDKKTCITLMMKRKVG